MVYASTIKAMASTLRPAVSQENWRMKFWSDLLGEPLTHSLHWVWVCRPPPRGPACLQAAMRRSNLPEYSGTSAYVSGLGTGAESDGEKPGETCRQSWCTPVNRHCSIPFPYTYIGAVES
ncbi:hypothetical protein GCM10009552_04140 [Rothia nasimurium]